jgi:hypothetical protein
LWHLDLEIFEAAMQFYCHRRISASEELFQGQEGGGGWGGCIFCPNSTFNPNSASLGLGFKYAASIRPDIPLPATGFMFDLKSKCPGSIGVYTFLETILTVGKIWGENF